MKKYLVAFASVLAFSAPAMASEQAIEFMSDAQLGQHNGARLVGYFTDVNGSGSMPLDAFTAMEWIKTVGKGQVTINGEDYTTVDNLGNPITARVARLWTKLVFMDGQKFRTHNVVRGDGVVTITTR